MSLAKRKFREIIFQLLFSNIFVDSDEDVLVPFMMNQIKTTKKNSQMALNYVKKILTNIKEIDKEIQKVSYAYDIERICKVEISILRLALYEMLYDENIPCKVALSEAIRLTKKFAGVPSASFINAILDAIYHERENTEK